MSDIAAKLQGAGQAAQFQWQVPVRRQAINLSPVQLLELVAVGAITGICLGSLLMGAQLGLFAAATALTLAATVGALALYPICQSLSADIAPNTPLKEASL